MSKLKKMNPHSPSKSGVSTSTTRRSSEDMSRTMKFASTREVNASTVLPEMGTFRRELKMIKAYPHSNTLPSMNPALPKREQYWAARALAAEALLRAQENHRHELRSLLLEEDIKRARENTILAEQYKQKHAGLEKLVVTLVASICFLVALVIYLATHFTLRSIARNQWSLPSHFTIPILSPFTSVVEHETSVVGSRTITMLFALAAGFGYLIFRYHYSRPSGR